ncbi:MAG: nicotinic acid mononucleotide adenylyltransferase, partial [Clostridia bacterium]|nr:nicotinic acid mononucleotide adenylyltransferase [Clostridia bacterium]
MARTLIFGGAFDPLHKEHVRICKAALEELGADKLVIVPTYQPPHK